MSERVRTSDNSVLQLVKGKDKNIKKLPLEDGRLSFAVDSKKIYLDCDFTDSMGDTYNDRLAFGGNSGIYYGVREFTTNEIENSEFIFTFPDQFDVADEEIPSVDDLILNNDGCFYRVNEVIIENEILVHTTKLTVAGSGGGGGGMATGLVVAKDPNQQYNIIAASKSIPIGFKVTDSLSNTTIDVTVSINGVEAGVFRNVIKNEYTSIDLYKYIGYFITNNANTVTLRFTNEYDHAAQLTLRNIRIIDLEVRLDSTNLGVKKTRTVNINIKPYGGSAMYDRFINVRLHTPGQLNTEVVTVPYDETIDNGETYVYTITDLITEGNYTADIWLTAHAMYGDTELLVSPEVVVSFIYRDAASNAPILSASIDAYEFNQYDVATITYLIAYEGAPSSIHLICYHNDELYGEQLASVSNNTPHEWKITLNKSGNYKFIVAIENYGLEEIIDGVVVSQTAVEIPYINVEDGSLQLYLDASGRSNNEMHPDVWTYKDINCRFENFNWNTNGWLSDENNTTSLHLTNGAKLTVPFAVFDEDATNANGSGKAIEIVYKLSNIRDENAIFIKAASEYNDVIQTGIISTGSIISLNTRNNETYKKVNVGNDSTDIQERKHNGLQAYISENERIHVTFSIQTKNPTNANANFIYTYVNGILSSLKQYDNTDYIQQISSDPSYIIVDSTYGDVDIYSIRVYNKYIADTLVLNNYAADLPTIEQKMFVKNNNDVLVGGQINLTKVAELGNIPYLVVTDLREVKDKKATGGIISEISALTTGKKDFRWCPCYYVDPEDQKHKNDENYIPRSFGSPTNLVEAVMYGQGTSSMAFPVKNFRLRFKNKADKYSLKPAVPLLTEAEAEKWEHLPKVALFTFKADYMDSSMSHNTGTGNALAALYDSINLKTPAQIAYPDKTICTNVVGHPCVVFWRTGDIGTETFIGRYNFNTDKAEHELFGFFEDDDTGFGKLKETVLDENNNPVTRYKWGFQSTLDESKAWDDSQLYNKTYYSAPRLDAEWPYNGVDDHGAAMAEALKNGPLYEYVEGPRTIQCWEFLDNSSALDNFRSDWHEEDHPDYDSKTSWVTSFESRYPEHQETQYGSTSTKYQYCSDFRAFSRLINWLNSTNQVQATNELFDTPVSIAGRTYDSDSKEYRLAKFQNEITQYMDLNFTIFYYIMTQVLLMVDSRAKNMMMCSYDLDSDAGTGHWFPIFYDMDTILGVNNQGSLVFGYSENDATTRVYNAGANYGTYNANNEWIPNTEYSVLWCNLREGFTSEIATMYQNLRNAGKLSVNYLLRCYNTQQSHAFAEIYDNHDGNYKYIRPLTEESKVLNLETGEYETTTSDYLYVEQGTREYHRETFLTKRLNMLDTLYHYYQNNEDIYIRANGITTERTHPDPHPFQFTFTAQDYQYGTYVYGRAQSDTELFPGVPTLSTMPAGANDTANNLEVWLYNLGSIYDIGDLSDKFADNIDIKHKLKLRTLQVGNSDPEYHYKTAAKMTLAGLNNLPLLESIDVSKVEFDKTTLNLSENVYLKNVYAKGSNLTNFSFAPGANIQHLELPASLTTLTLKNFLFYDTINTPSNLQIEAYNKIISINIEGCPLVDTQSLIETIMAQDETANGQLISIRLPDINWSIQEINNDTCELIEQELEGQTVTIINDIKVLDYATSTLESIDDNGNPVSVAETNNQYFGGRLFINNEDYYINDLYLQNKYKYKYPNLEIVYGNPEKVIAGYTINVINVDTNEPIPRSGDKRNSIVIDSVEADGFNLQYYLEHDIDMAAISKLSTPQWNYNFVGWTTVKTWNGDGGLKTNDETELAVAFNNGYQMVFDEDTAEWLAPTAPTSLPLSAYTNHELNLYPVFSMTTREYTITFMYTEEGVTPKQIWAQKLIPYNSPITLPDNLPAVIDKDPDSDQDVSKTTIRRLTTYRYGNKEYSEYRVQDNMELYPVYETSATYMQNVVAPPVSYFDTYEPKVTSLFGPGGDKFTVIDEVTGNVNELSIADNGIVAVIKQDTSVPAICVPKMIGDKYVVSLKNESPFVERIYFESGCPIRYFIGADSGFNGTLIKNNNIQFNGFTEGANNTLEFIDLAALTQLHTIGGEDDSTVEGTAQIGLNNPITGIFAACPKLHISGLPDSLMIIGTYTFAGDTALNFNRFPQNLLLVQDHAFEDCTGLESIEFPEGAFTSTTLGNIIDLRNNYTPGLPISQYWPRIGMYAFSGCSNLVFSNLQTLYGVRSIDNNAFRDCKKLIFMPTPEYSNETLVYIGVSAFANCSSIKLTKLPNNLIELGAYAFAGCGTIGIGNIFSAIRTIGEGVFSGCTVKNGNICHVQLDVPVDLEGEGSTLRSVVHINPNAFGGLILGNSAAELRINMPEVTDWSNPDYRELEPWVSSSNAFGAKRKGDETGSVAETVPVVFFYNGGNWPTD